jgi:hypothetical protein
MWQVVSGIGFGNMPRPLDQPRARPNGILEMDGASDALLAKKHCRRAVYSTP